MKAGFVLLNSAVLFSCSSFSSNKVNWDTGVLGHWAITKLDRISCLRSRRGRDVYLSMQADYADVPDELWERVKQWIPPWRASFDSASVKSQGGEVTGPNPTDRGKLGTKRHVLTDGRGIPLAVTLTGANRILASANGPTYVFDYVKGSTDKFVTIFENQSGLAYRHYKSMSHNVDSDDFDVL